MTKCKLACFDLDGTIIDETIFIWHTLHEYFGTNKAFRKKNTEAFYAGKLSYANWAKMEVEEWKRLGANKQKILAALAPLKLMLGAQETLQKLKEKGVKLAIISGSINTALEKVLPNYGEFFDDVFINTMQYDEHGNILGIEPTPYDIEHKATALKNIAQREGIPLKSCVFVGDHHNDVAVAKTAGFSIAFNCKSDSLAQVADVVIEKKDLREILPHIL